MMNTKAYVVVGRPKAGKTYWTKQRVAALGRPLLVWDINAEWGQSAPDEPKFVEQVKKATNAVIVWEEAVSFFDGPNSRLTNAAQKLVSRRRHAHNTHFLLFTSLRSVPTKILENVDRIILFKTNDIPSVVADKFRGWPQVLAALEYQRTNPDEHRPVDINIFGA